MKICGPKLSLCCLILSIWGLFQLSLIGIFFYFHSVAFQEDLALKDFREYANLGEFYAAEDAYYTQNAHNCWIAAGMYGITLFTSFTGMEEMELGRQNWTF
uniref:Uncharacterized protein n=1 Tax=Megaselia scalaris TaxID=36166 RepID=T1H0K2_MEGSC